MVILVFLPVFGQAMLGVQTPLDFPGNASPGPVLLALEVFINSRYSSSDLHHRNTFDPKITLPHLKIKI